MAAPRPMTHDLTRNLIHHLNGELERVVITELRDDTFFASLVAEAGRTSRSRWMPGRRMRSRLALRADCPIYVAEQVMQAAKLNTNGDRPKVRPQNSCAAGSKGLNDEDLGRYKM